MSRLVRVSLICLVSLLIACADDLDFPDNRRSLDITNENAEEHLWSAYKVFFEALYFASLDETLDSTSFDQGKPGSCSAQDSVTLGFTRQEGDEYEENDEFSVTYSDCVKPNNVTYKGDVRGKYLEVEGYNSAFLDSVSVEQCVEQVEKIKGDEEDLEDPARIVNQAESVAFDRQGDRLFVRYLNSGGALGSQVTVFVEELPSDRDAIVVNFPETDLPSTLESDSDGAQLFKVKDGEQEQINCLSYKRRVELELENLELVKGSIKYSLSGTLEIIEEVTEPGRINYRLLGDDISVVLSYGNTKESYYLNDLEWRQESELLVNSTYAISFDSELVNRLDGSISESRSLSGSPLRGEVGEPTVNDGILSVLGINLENAAFNVNSSSSITFAIEAEGDRNGNGSSDPTADNFDSSWSDFLGRIFVRPPETVVEEIAPGPDSNSNVTDV